MSQGRDPYINEYFTKREYGDFTPFYVTITICCVLVAILLILNLIFCCSSQYKHYWSDINTGNQLIVPIWTRTPHNQPALDYAELEGKAPPPPEIVYPPDFVEVTYPSVSHYSEYRHQQYYQPPKRESDI